MRRALACAALAVCLSCVSGFLPMRTVRLAHQERSEDYSRCVSAVDALLQPTSFFDELRPGETDRLARTPAVRAASKDGLPPDSLSFFAPAPSEENYDDPYDDLLPPKAPEPVREGEIPGAYSDAAEGRTEGWYAALQESPDRLRASDLNEVLQPDHLDRLRFMNFPLQAYGMLFKWDTLIEDVIQVHRTPWQVVAEEHGLRVPDDDEVMRAIGMRPERAIEQTFRWTADWGECRQYAFEHFEAKANMMRSRDFSVADGVLNFLELLQEYKVPCCLCAGTTLDSAAAKSMLSKAGIERYFDEFVTAEDGCETLEQNYLVAAIKLRRPPRRCVVFEDDPRGVVAAHEATSKVVALLGSQPGVDLRHADMRVSEFEDLSLMSIRELFKAEPPIE